MFKKILSIFIGAFFIFNLTFTFNISAYCKEKKREDYLKNNFIICIDPGHQGKGDPRCEAVSPNSNNMKPRVSSGTAGVATKNPEHVINLEAALILKDLLIKNGYTVIMTRESADVNISNIERAQIANNSNADLTIRIHCDSINDSGKTGAVILVPDKTGEFTKQIYKNSNKYAEILKKKLEENNVKVNGIFERKDITGFNWSTVPVIIFEMGFMSNYNEDKMLSDKTYQMKLMECVSNSIDEYKNISY